MLNNRDLVVCVQKPERPMWVKLSFLGKYIFVLSQIKQLVWYNGFAKLRIFILLPSSAGFMQGICYSLDSRLNRSPSFPNKHALCNLNLP